METTETLLRAILSTLARSTFPPREIHKILAAGTGGDKQVTAYNLCDGKTAQAEIGKRANLDGGNLSRSIARWIESGIVIRIGKEQYPMHVYPLVGAAAKTRSKEK